MGVDFYWQKVGKGMNLETNSPSRIHGVLERQFGELPITITSNAIPWLNGAHALDRNEPIWEQIVDHLQKHGEIRIWCE